MRWLRALLLLLSSGLLLQAAAAQVPLQYKLPEKFWVELKSEYKRTFKSVKGEIKDRTDSTQVFAITVLKTNEDGSKEVELVVDSLKDVITDDKGKRESNHPEMQGATVKLTLDANMNLTKLDGIVELQKKNDPKGLSKPAARAYQLEHLDNQFRFWASQVFVPMPSKPVSKGDKWEQKLLRTLGVYGNLRMTRQLTYQGTETVADQELQKLTFTTAHAFAPLKQGGEAMPFIISRMTVAKGENTGTIYFDAAAGRLVRAEAKDLRDLILTLAYDDFNREVRLKDEGTLTIRYLENKP
jgi:hypothetical protein